MKRIVGLLVVALFACAGAYAQTKNYLKTPDNIRETVEYNDSLNVYYIGQKMGDSYLNVPTLMTPEEYRQYVEKRALHDFFHKKN